ncbi:hypothetical protein FB567DRAFT_589384 [Paraphoma chrysanthemicola]|uniref:Uncharacterized protein n=1 Tax=Paraphoma chrysanthemicola TaxID=798071 RepID=A0A8K0RFH0_9PLEO|nr:hypothetical protein FB567DRAFT_589384 [Paraphoma chrysanthemicola]
MAAGTIQQGRLRVVALEFQGVLHFRSNWDDLRIRTMYEDKFVILADNVAKFRADLNMAYSKFKETDATLNTTGPGGVGGYDQLFVTGSPLQATRTSRKRGWNEDVGGKEDEEEDFIQAIKRTRR